jgi:hypothetical protein
VRRLALFVEFGLPSLRTYHQNLSISAAHRFSGLSVNHLGKQLFNAQYHSPAPSAKLSPDLVPFAHRVRSIEAHWNIDHSSWADGFRQSLRARALSLQLTELHNSNFSCILRQLTPSPRPTSYILSDPRRIAVLRARIRLNRNKLNQSLVRRKPAHHRIVLFVLVLKKQVTTFSLIALLMMLHGSTVPTNLSLRLSCEFCGFHR